MQNDCKSAVVTPLYKNKGDTDNLNNYSGISVLPQIAKLFEKIMAKQITCFLNANNLLSTSQNVFRSAHNCESSLHEILTEINQVRSKRLIGLLIFIDFRKAFDVVDSKLLLIKLSKYGFDALSIRLLRNYFSNRMQFVKIDEFQSSLLQIILGVPLGSFLGPLLFLIFINDIVIYLNEFISKLFADDTTIFIKGDNLVEVMEKFQQSITKLLNWCSLYRIYINWEKTKVMFTSNKRIIAFPTKEALQVTVDKVGRIEVVQEFKLLGLTIDKGLKFTNLNT
ncbi:unnamed protein product [Brachionus calyciflorus]|uniref:Reverse transcriptase domain-containing protein n=1 Tax=Brachionus calyciflorus TaxID=104777 RepID=A0A814G6W8_9BILA|nr:unnamed protein product [Brachionus calyciflorus]